MVDKIKRYNNQIFENIKYIDENGNEFWEARELQLILGYTQWRNFELVISRAKEACEKSGNNSFYDFADTRKIVKAGATTKVIIDYKLSRYACYLIVQNGDSRKEIIALGQTYFAIQTRSKK